VLDLRRTAEDLRPHLQGRILQLAGELAPGGYVAGGEYIAPNPTGATTSIRSFKIRLAGHKTGSFVDYAGDDRPFRNGGDRGDIFDLIAYCRFDRNRAKAIAWALEWCGRSGTENTKDVRLATARRALALSEDDREKARRARAQRIWRRGLHHISGTIAETYLREARKIPLEEITSHTRDLRFSPELKHPSGMWLPAIVAALRDRDGNITGVHCTFLAPDGSGKAAIEPKKIMHGRAVRSVIRVANGETRLSPEEAAAGGSKGLLILAEGLEDALTLAAIEPKARVWAAGSLGNLGHAPVDHPCVSRVILAADNDINQPRAWLLVERALEQLREHREVIVVRSPAGNDWNDALRGAV
jgi:hypothetical protein